MITSLSIHNFKSLRKVELDNIPAFMVLVGRNSSGKSNFINALQFLFSVMTNGLSQAIDEYGGYENICFRRMRRSKGSVRFVVNFSIPFAEIPGSMKFDLPGMSIGCIYIFEFRTRGRTIDAPYSISFESLQCSIFDHSRRTPWFQFTRKGNKIDNWTIKEDADNDRNLQSILKMISPPARELFADLEFPATELIVASRLPSLFFYAIPAYFEKCRAYHLTPEEARKSVEPSGAGTILEKFGGNLASVIRFLKKEQKEDFGSLLEHARVAVSSIKDIDTKYTDNKLLCYRLHEEGFGRPWLPEDVSDGTVQSLCLFIPLEDRRIQLAAYDEPENSVHPWIQRDFVRTCVQKSVKKQIILATHSIAALDEVPPESLFIIERNRSGESYIRSVTIEHPQIKEIIEEKIMKLGEYWDSGAMGGVPTQLRMEFEE